MATVVDWPGSRGDWRDKLMMRARKGRPPEIMPSYTNLEIILGNDPKLRGVLGYDEFREMPVMLREFPDSAVLSWPGPFPRPWGEPDVSAMHSYVERIYSDRFRSPMAVERAMLATCRIVKFHPVRDWLDQLAWDNEARLDTWLYHVFGVELTAYTAAVARKTLIAAVRRVHEPGCKFDHVLILHGPQDLGKSMAIELLAGAEFFSDSLPLDFGNKDALLGLSGHWMIELGEIEHLMRNSSGLAKSFLSRHTDRFRPPYGKVEIAQKRQCILIATTNERHFLRDDTGNRRFWPVLCEKPANLDWLRDNRDFLFAEAMAAEADEVREQLWIDHRLMTEAHSGAADAQTARLEAHDDPWMQPALDYLDGRRGKRNGGDEPDVPRWREFITTDELLTDALLVPRGQQHRGHAMRVGKILRLLGWADRRSNGEGAHPYPRNVRYWSRAGTG